MLPTALATNPLATGTGTPSADAYRAENPYAAAASAGNPYAATITSNPDSSTDDNAAAAADGADGTSPYMYGESPIGGFMRGYARTVNAVTQGLIDEQDARRVRIEVRKEQLENERQAFDLRLFVRENTPSAEDERQRSQQLQLRRALNDPPPDEINSGQALNTILDELARKHGKETDSPAPAVELNADIFRNLNFTTRENRGSSCLLREGGRLTWPAAFLGPPYEEDRARLNDLAPTLCAQAMSGRLDPSGLEAVNETVRRLRQALADRIRDLTPRQYSEARRFLSDLDDALTLLRQPDAATVLGTKAPGGPTAVDLVRQMVERGIRFAPATSGHESAYAAVHRALAQLTGPAAEETADESPPE
jgi:hypothetical protein